MFIVLFWRWLTAMSWSFTWCWCLRTILNIFQLLAMITEKKRKPNPIGIKNHLFVIQNLSNTVTVTNIHKINVVWNTRGPVTIVLYRRWRVSAKSRSTDTAAKMRKETPPVVQPDRDWTTLKVQNTTKFFSSSAILYPTKSGWHVLVLYLMLVPSNNSEYFPATCHDHREKKEA